jgi:hypothetical protein
MIGRKDAKNNARPTDPVMIGRTKGILHDH